MLRPNRPELEEHSQVADFQTSMLGGLFLRCLVEKSTTEIAKTRDAQGFGQNLGAAQAGGSVSGVARAKLELETG